MLPVFSKKTKIKIDRLHFSGEKKVGFRGFSGLWAGSLQGGGGGCEMLSFKLLHYSFLCSLSLM